VIFDQSGWWTVDGPRFFAFLPLGQRAQLDLDILVLGKVFHWAPESVLHMSCSRRRRMIRLQEEVVRQENAAAKGQTTDPQPTIPTGIASKQEGSEPINLNYGV
jgi:hypothetical protein